MAEKDEKILFKELYKNYIESRAVNECSWFGIISGICLSSFSAYQSLCTTGVVCIIFKVLAFLGLILIFLGGFLPLKLKKTAQLFKNTFSLVGGIVLKVFLIPVYFVITFINAFKYKKYSNKFNFIQWSEGDIVNSTYYDYNDTIKKRNKNVVIDIINAVFFVFLNKKMYVVIPIVVILLTLGLVMFFASSNAVFSFVYTLF